MTWAIIFWCVVFVIGDFIALSMTVRANSFGGKKTTFEDTLRALYGSAAIATTFTFIAIGIVAAFQGIFA